MKRILFLLAAICSLTVSAQLTKFYSQTRTYDSIISCYKRFDAKSKMATLQECGTTDIGKPLHLFILSKSGVTDPVAARKEGDAILLINNGIHPGEPDGIDASIEMVDYYLDHPDSLPKHIVILIIPVYNVDGCLNRSSTSRANQNGPDEYGFRGNAKNLDLNRDFIKCDAQNTRSLESVFAKWNPDVFVDTHVSDGADYQYTMTLISTAAKLQPDLGKYMMQVLTPDLYSDMKGINDEMCPYVDAIGKTPESGIAAFLETPRFSTGYAGLRNCIGYVSETHMLKNYNNRVWSTYHLLQFLVKRVASDSKAIIENHTKADNASATQQTFGLNLELDTARFTPFDFKGYEAGYQKSDISTQLVLYYDHTAPFTKQIKYYQFFKPTIAIDAPAYYVIPQAWTDVIDRLKLNGVLIRELKHDSVINVEAYYIDSFQTSHTPYESHYLHSEVKTRAVEVKLQYYKGDVLVQMNQALNQYIITVLEPGNNDSYFCWNFFDGILQQKEWFSDYVWEAKADSLLKADPYLKDKFRLKMKMDTTFANDHWSQLAYIYKNSAYMEITYDRYPVTRINRNVVADY